MYSYIFFWWYIDRIILQLLKLTYFMYVHLHFNLQPGKVPTIDPKSLPFRDIGACSSCPFCGIRGSSESACSTGSDAGPCLLRKFGWCSYMGRSTKETRSRSGVVGRHLENLKFGRRVDDTHPGTCLDMAFCMSFSDLVDISIWLKKKGLLVLLLMSHFMGILTPRCLPTLGGGKELVALLPKEAHLNHLNLGVSTKKSWWFCFKRVC